MPRISIPWRYSSIRP